MKAYRYLVNRLLLFIPVVFGILTLTFILSRIIPTDPMATILGPKMIDEIWDTEVFEHYLKLYGLDLPLHEQYIKYLTDVLHGDFGLSLQNRLPVMNEIVRRFPNTILLALLAIIIAVGVGIPLGIISAVKRDSVLDHASRIFALGGIAMPSFWFALLLLLVFYYRLGWFPGVGMVSIGTIIPRITGVAVIDALLQGNWSVFYDALGHLVLPTTALSFRLVATLSRHTRSSMLEVMGKDYIRTARSKGLTERVVIMRHALKNALIPPLTVSGLMIGGLLGGSVLVETVFSYPGMGWYAATSIVRTDFNAIMAVTIIFAIIYSSINLIVDLIYGYLDPRISY